jgi:hypothetical protein
MKIARSVALISCLVCASAAAQPPSTIDGRSNWQHVVRLKPGTEIVLEVHGLTPVSRHFLSADDSELVVLDLTDPALPKEVRRTLRELAVKHPRFLDPGGRVRTRHGRVHVTAEGVFVRDQKVAQLEDVFDRIARRDVVMVATPRKRHGSARGALVGAAAGFVGGWFFARLPLRFAYSGNPLWLVAMIGLPIAGAVLGYEAETRTTQTIIYRASGAEQAPSGRLRLNQ